MQLRVLLAVLLGFLAGCGGTPVSQDLTQNEANEIVAMLTSQGISAVSKREVGGRGFYSVEIRDDRYPEAISLLHAKGLPRERSPWVKEILSSQGIIPSSREIESLRLDYALGAQIEDILRTHPAVSAARVIVRMNSIKEGEEPSAVAVVQIRSGAKVAVEEFPQLILGSVPGLKLEHIKVVQGDVKDEGGKKHVTVGVTDEGTYLLQVPLVPFLFFWRVPQSEYTGLALTILGVLFIVGAMGIGLGYWSGLYRQSQKPIESELPMVLSKSTKIERVTKEFREIS